MGRISACVDRAMLMCTAADLSTSTDPECLEIAAFVSKAKAVPGPSRWYIRVWKAGMQKVV